jgi:membrane protein
MKQQSTNKTSLWGLLKNTFDEWNADGASRLAAALAYYTVFALAPLLVIAVAISGFFLGREAAQGQLLDQIETYTNSPETATLLQTMIHNAGVRETGLLATVLSVALLLWGASGVFGELRNALNNIWDVPPRPDEGWRKMILNRLVTLLMVVVSGVLLFASLLASTVLAAASDWLGAVAPEVAIWSQVITFVFFFLLTLLIFALIYRYVPDIRLAWSDVWAGAVATALLFSIGRLLISWYLGQSSAGSTYGAAGSLVVLLLWIYYSAQVFFLGAEFTQVYGRTFGTRREEHQLIETPRQATPTQTAETPEGTIVPAPPAAAPPPVKAEPPPRPESTRRRHWLQPLAKLGAAVSVITVLSVVNFVAGPMRRDAARKDPEHSSA